MGLAAARAEAERAYTDLKNDIDPAAEKEELKTHPETPEEVVAEFIHRRLGGTKTQDEMERIFRVYVLPHWKHRLRVGDVTRADVPANSGSPNGQGYPHHGEPGPESHKTALEVVRRRPWLRRSLTRGWGPSPEPGKEPETVPVPRRAGGGMARDRRARLSAGRLSSRSSFSPGSGGGRSPGCGGRTWTSNPGSGP